MRLGRLPGAGTFPVAAHIAGSSVWLYTYMGSPSTFRGAGFRDLTPTGQARPVMRYYAQA
jgi:hypothetical protein